MRPLSINGRVFYPDYLRELVCDLCTGATRVSHGVQGHKLQAGDILVTVNGGHLGKEPWERNVVDCDGGLTETVARYLWTMKLKTLVYALHTCSERIETIPCQNIAFNIYFWSTKTSDLQ